MEKKTYIAPQAEAVDIEVSLLFATSGIEVKPGEWGDDQLSNRRRGQWGNLWADEK